MKKISAILFLVIILGISRQAHADISSGLVGYWNFDEGSGTIAADSSGNSHAGSLSGGATWTAGKIGSGAISLDGATGQVTVSGISNLPEISIALWIKFGDTAATHRFFDRDGSSPIIRLVGGGGVQFIGTVFQNGSTTLQPNTWYHIVAVGGAAGHYLYVNGALDGSSATPYAISNAAPIVIGGSLDPFLGSIDDVRVYSRALSSSDVSELYAYAGGSSGGGGTVTPPPSDPTPPASDTTAPVISSVASGSVTSSGAAVSWSTNKSADSQIEYGLTTGYGNSTAADASLVTFHSASLSGLTANTLYHYRVKSKDASGNLATGGDNTFTTSAAAAQQTGSGTNFYIAQATAGSADATSCANAQSISWLNTAGNWASSGAGKVIPGSTVHICGTISTTLAIQGSGSSGNPITIFFEPGAKFSKSFWPTDSPAIYSAGRSYITVDGNNTGIIENTANGTNLANQQNTWGMDFESGTGVTIRRLTIQNLYVRTADSSDFNGSSGVGIRAINTASVSNLVIDSNTINYSKYGIVADMSGANYITVSNNNISRCSTMTAITKADAANTAGVYVFGNTFSGGNYWDYPSGDVFHGDGLHMWTSTGAFTDVTIYRNNMLADWGVHTTGAIFMEGNFGAMTIYDNLLGTLAEKLEAIVDIAASNPSGTTANIYNNTIIGQGTNNFNGAAVYLQGSRWNAVSFKNNAIYNFYDAVVLLTTQAKNALDFDYNSYYSIAQIAARIDPASGDQSGASGDLASWISYLGGGDESHSKTTNPAYASVTTGSLQASSPLIDAGAALGSQFAVDFSGISRPQGSAWDIGAYEYSGSLVTPPPADTTAPSVSITSPSAGTISGSVSLAASASDDTGVAGVQFKLDGTNLGSELTAAPYSGTWNTSGVSNGSHTLTAVARDAAGNTKTSNSVTVTVSNSTADTSAPSTPTGITSSSLTQTRVTLSWLAAVDNVGVSGYKVFRNGVLIASPTANTYAVTGLSANTLYAFTVSAYDAAGNTSSLSLPLSITTAANPVTTFTLSASKSGSGTGTISGAGISCGSTCLASVTSGTSITLTATPSPDSTFDGWSGACTNSSGTCTTTVTSAKSVSAIFTLIPVTTPVTPPASGGGNSGGGSSGGGGGGSSSSATVTSSPTGTFTPTVPQSPIISVPIKGTGIILTKNLYRGITDLEVTTLQKYLIAQGYLGGTATGYFGPLTEAGVMRYQAAHGISQTGTIGPITRASLAGGSAVTTIPTSSGSILAFTRSLTIGSTGTDVKYLQIFLNKHGFQVSLSGAGSPNNETSYFGPATTKALAKFQLAKGISPAVGYFGPLTMKAVNSIK